MAIRSDGIAAIRAHRHGDKHALQRIEVFAEIARVADVDGITLAAFDGRRDGLAANGGFNDVVYIADGEAVTRCGFAVRR